jgi:hypothetical protein
MIRFWVASLMVAAAFAEVNVGELVKKSVAATDRDWREAPKYVYTLTEVDEKLDSNGNIKSKTVNTWEVMVLDGSEYKKLIARNGKPLSAKAQAAEEKKFWAEKWRREHQSPSEREKRIARYEKGRKQDHAMMREMTVAFNYKLIGEEKMNGHDAYVLSATPKPDYVPKSRETKVLKGMKGKLWIDKQTNQWVKVEAEVIHPVSFYAVASVGPGTKFVLEQEPVGDGVWLPKRFAVDVNASVFWFSRNTSEVDTYSNYRRADVQATAQDRSGGH